MKMSAIDTPQYHIEDIQKATYNGVKVKLFKAFKKQGMAYIFCGQYRAPQRTANKNLEKFVVDAADDDEDDE